VRQNSIQRRSKTQSHEAVADQRLQRRRRVQADDQAAARAFAFRAWQASPTPQTTVEDSKRALALTANQF
jgi:hypothetical protein